MASARVTWPSEPLPKGCWQIGPFCSWCQILSGRLFLADDKTPKIKIKQTTNSKDNQTLSLHLLCVKMSAASASPAGADPPRRVGPQTNTDKRTQARPSSSLLLLSVCSSYCWGLEFCLLSWCDGEGEGDRWKEGVRTRRRMVLSCSGPLCRWPAPACSSVSVSSPARPAPKLTKSENKAGRGSANRKTRARSS